MDYVTIKKLSEQIGYSEVAIRRKIQRGTWIRDVHWVKAPDGRILMVPEAIQRWIGGQHYDNQHKGKSLSR